MVAEPILVGRQLWTYDNLVQLEDETRREICHGDLFEMPAPTNAHQRSYRALIRFLERWIEAGGTGLLYYQPCDLVIDSTTVFIPDLVFYTTTDISSIEHESGRGLVGVPDLVVELISPSTAGRDRVLKYREYAAFGVKHYWIIDPEAQILHAFVLRDGHYADEAALVAGEVFSPGLFPGLAIPLNELFEIPNRTSTESRVP